MNSRASEKREQRGQLPHTHRGKNDIGPKPPTAKLRIGFGRPSLFLLKQNTEETFE